MPPKKRQVAEETSAEIPATGDVSLEDISKSLDELVASGKNSTVTCGGSIPVADVAARVPRAREEPPSQADGPGKKGKKKARGKAARKPTPAADAHPIVVRWDRPDNSEAKVRFPVDEDDTAAFETFVADCQPAGFGHQGQDVYDENVRMATAMDGSCFSTNLCPYSLGIVDRIQQLLLPNFAGIGPGGITDKGFVRAELYKVNVYQGPSGFIKSHVDTPRGKTQFGSLVLCLPRPHEGGRLTVTHGKFSQAFDWDKQGGAKALQWAAFYSDCEHEVSPVTSGHRVTVTYNLYYELRAQDKQDPLSGLDRKPAPVDITSLAPYGVLQRLLQNPLWMKDGGRLGIYCAHAYPTTTSKVIGPEYTDEKYYISDTEYYHSSSESEGEREARLQIERQGRKDRKDQRERERERNRTALSSDQLTALKGTDIALYAAVKYLGLVVHLAPIVTGLDTCSSVHHKISAVISIS